MLLLFFPVYVAWLLSYLRWLSPKKPSVYSFNRQAHVWHSMALETALRPTGVAEIPLHPALPFPVAHLLCNR
jgi:hypothetical protein